MKGLAEKMCTRLGLPVAPESESLLVISMGLSALFRDVEAEKRWLAMPQDDLQGRTSTQAIADGDIQSVERIVRLMCGW